MLLAEAQLASATSDSRREGASQPPSWPQLLRLLLPPTLPHSTSSSSIRSPSM